MKPIPTLRLPAIVTTLAYGETETRAEFDYDPADPYAVSMTADGVTWTFARDLLVDGLKDMTGHTHVGDGDVVVSRLRDICVIRLHSHAGSAAIRVPCRSLHRWVRTTFEVVPDGAEVLDIDAAIVALLNETH